MELDKREGESDLSYHKRIVYGKLVDKTLSDFDYSELAERIYGKEYASDVARRMMYGSRKTIEAFEADGNCRLPADAVAELEQKKIDLQIERQKFFDQRNALSKIVRDKARYEELDEVLIKSIACGNIPVLEYTYTEHDVGNNDLLVSLNDIHYGAVVDNYWRKYNPEICAAMMSRYIDNIVDIANTHNSENCYVFCNGDAISGNIHYSISVSNKENVIDQIKGVSELISEFLAELSKHFRNVYYVSVAGNHSRINPDKDKSLISERLDDLVGWYMHARLQNFENINIEAGDKIDETMYLLDIRGKTYLGIHGDFDVTPSNIQSLQTMAGRNIYAILSGHLHHNEVNSVQGIKTVQAGSFLGMDEYCVQKRIYGKPEQMVCVCDADGIRCYYDINL